MYECPLTFITEETHRLMDALYMFEASGITPWPGGWVDQPAFFVQAYRVFRAEENIRIKREIDLIKTQSKKTKK